MKALTFFVFTIFSFFSESQAGVAAACSGQIFLPFPIPEMISGEQFKKPTCQDNDQNYISALTCFHECTTEKALLLDKSGKVLTSCWKRYGKRTDPPQGQKQILEFFCNTNNSWMYKNMVDYCVISTLSDGFTNRIAMNEFSKCPGIRAMPNRYLTPKQKGRMTGFRFPPRQKDLFASAMTMAEGNDRIRKICKEKDQHLLVTEVFENECFLRSHPKLKANLQECWSMMIPNSTYPEKIEQWQSFICTSSEPYYGLREGFEFCLMNQFGLRRHSECDRFHLLQKSYHIFRPELPPATVDSYVRRYQEQKESRKSAPSKDAGTADTSLQQMKSSSMCKNVPPKGLDGASKIDRKMRRFLRMDPIVCLATSSPEVYAPLIDSCFDFVTSGNSSTNSADKQQKLSDLTDQQWISLVCSYEKNGRDANSLMAEVKSCIRSSFTRANEWMKSSKLMGKFKRNLVKGGPPEEFLEAYKMCMH